MIKMILIGSGIEPATNQRRGENAKVQILIDLIISLDQIL